MQLFQAFFIVLDLQSIQRANTTEFQWYQCECARRQIRWSVTRVTNEH